ncbi:M23 family metallopeptidase [Candidatus Microgenomates bacterium]|nr:M23 family metallopeptidase [Candidatus Microgenomates bacterium]
MENQYKYIIELAGQLNQFFRDLGIFLAKKFHISFMRFEEGKGVFVTALYKQRGKLARRLMHTGMATLAGVGMVIAPVIAQEFPGRSVNPWEITSNTPTVLSATSEGSDLSTLISEKVRDKIIEYDVVEGDTVASISNKFGVSEDTVRWQNGLTKDKIKIGQTLEILPVAGIAHKVAKGDTVYSIAKKYDTESQGIVDFPFNSFSNDETFALAIGQTVVVPDGIKPTATGYSPRIRTITPDAGSVVASGSFAWPASGSISQNYSWYHPGVDIANRAAPAVLAADSGVVTYAGCLSWGYGCHVRIDHGNGSSTLYAHLQTIYVNVGQSVARGNSIGKMGSTGRSTGTHLHFEVVRSGARLSPLTVLR